MKYRVEPDARVRDCLSSLPIINYAINKNLSFVEAMVFASGIAGRITKKDGEYYCDAQSISGLSKEEFDEIYDSMSFRTECEEES